MKIAVFDPFLERLMGVDKFEIPHYDEQIGTGLGRNLSNLPAQRTEWCSMLTF